MDPAEKASTFAQAVSEGLNCLGVFLCGPALRKYRAQAPDLLRRWEAEYAPVLEKIDLPASGLDGAAFRASVAKVSLLVAAGVDPNSADQLTSLRAAFREMLAAMRVPVPVVPPAETAICELHGAACPFVADESGP
jgi:hypothetical protein